MTARMLISLQNEQTVHFTQRVNSKTTILGLNWLKCWFHDLKNSNWPSGGKCWKMHALYELIRIHRCRKYRKMHAFDWLTPVNLKLVVQNGCEWQNTSFFPWVNRTVINGKMPENAFQRVCLNSPSRKNVGKCMLSIGKLLWTFR